MRTTSSSAFRSLRVRPQAAQRRSASSNVEQAQKKAQEAFTVVQGKAGQALGAARKQAAPLVDSLLARLGPSREVISYNFSVAREVLKHIYIAERLQPPTWAETKAAYSLLAQRLANPAFLRELISSGEYAKVFIYGVEAYGIFKIGEIIGRRSIVGYNLS